MSALSLSLWLCLSVSLSPLSLLSLPPTKSSLLTGPDVIIIIIVFFILKVSLFGPE